MIHKEFDVYVLNQAGLSHAADIAVEFDTLLSRLEEIIPPCRELSIVATKLEEACFFAKKALAVQRGTKA